MKAARAVCDLPVVASATFAADGRTLVGHTPVEVATTLRDMGVDVIGANCSTGPVGVYAVIEQIKQVVGDVPLLAQPNAGWPERYH